MKVMSKYRVLRPIDIIVLGRFNLSVRSKDVHRLLSEVAAQI
jgi:hypothetical protein